MEIPECFTLKEAQFFTLLNTRKNTNEAKERMIKFCLKAKKKTLKYDVKLLSDKEQFLMALASILQGDKKLVNYGCDTNPRSADKMHDEILPSKSTTKQSLKSAGVQSESEMYMKQGSIDDQLQQDLKKSIAELDQAKQELEYLKGQKCCNPTLLQSQIFQLKRQLEILKDRETEKEVFVYNINENLQMIKIKLQEIFKDNPHNEISLIVKQLSSMQKHMQRREKQLKDVKPSVKIKTQMNIPEIELQYESLYKKLKALKCNVETCIQPNILPLFKDRNEEMFKNALDELDKAMKSLIQISSTLCYQDSKLSSKDVKSQVEESFNLSNFISNIPLSQSSKELVSSYFEPLFFKYEKIHKSYCEDILALQSELDFHKKLYSKYTELTTNLLQDVQRERMNLKNQIVIILTRMSRLHDKLGTLEWNEDIVAEYLIYSEKEIKQLLMDIKELINSMGIKDSATVKQ